MTILNCRNDCSWDFLVKDRKSDWVHRVAALKKLAQAIENGSKYALFFSMFSEMKDGLAFQVRRDFMNHFNF